MPKGKPKIFASNKWRGGVYYFVVDDGGLSAPERE